MKDNGGTAFPAGTQWLSPGMSLRDYFAAQALPVLVRAYIDANDDALRRPCTSRADIAAECYNYADAMLTERAT